ncbi:hypothetical protein [Paenibacillus campi]|nr:hypothetical protein [Paenibacillus sp. SGZ-1014]
MNRNKTMRAAPQFSNRTMVCQTLYAINPDCVGCADARMKHYALIAATAK